MKDSLFKLNTKLPKHVGRIPMYKTFHFETASSRNKEYAAYISERVDFLRSKFKTEGELEDVGDQLVIKNEKEALEIYTASDSFWWTDRENAYSENIKLAENLPNKDEAVQNAVKRLEALKIDTQFMKLHSVSNNFAAFSKSPKDAKGEQFPTSVNVNFNYELEGLPLFGAGAKTQVSYINNDQTVEILHFYRTPKQAGKAEVISPEEAVQQVFDNYRFAQLKDSDKNTGEITDVTLGYYTASPTDLQRYLIPVYKVKGSVSTPALENYDFNLFVIASTESQEMAKQKGQINTGLETVFN
ncbi:hypothetical protein IMCC3317_26590 [Kordia antarctica]|uniref:Uncharacterized protein n=1 Tax=Kordia antarctica TaxID=1218801 RepID=A0A7L4ZL79_9FLAO|nr:hypothetical protein [Kordia antarctica]QHI37280.1 hypothetical protein IMCC3317_26590 [Kordia antarctica]